MIEMKSGDASLRAKDPGMRCASSGLRSSGLRFVPFCLAPYPSTRAPEALNTLPRITISSRTSLSNSAGVDGLGVAPWLSMRSLTSGSSRIRPTSCEIVLITARGVFAGAKIPYQPSYSNPGSAASAIVGKSGISARRSRVVTASASNRPPLISDMAGSTGDMKYWMRPAIVSLIASGVPL